MNPDKFTHKTNEALVSAHEIATSNGHAQFTPLHLASSLISDKDGIFSQALSNAAGEESARAAERVINNALKKLPSQSPLPDEVPASNALVKAIRRAQTLQKKRGDTHLAVDQLILGLLEDSQIAELLNEAGVAASKVKSEVERLRGKEGKKVESATGDSTFQVPVLNNLGSSCEKFELFSLVHFFKLVWITVF